MSLQKGNYQEREVLFSLLLEVTLFYQGEVLSFSGLISLSLSRRSLVTLAAMESTNLAAFFGGQFYFSFDSSRQYVPLYYGPASTAIYDHHIASGPVQIQVLFSSEYLADVCHLITRMSSSVDSITGRHCFTFASVIRIGVEFRDFEEVCYLSLFFFFLFVGLI